MEKWDFWNGILKDGAEDLRSEVVIAELLIAGELTGGEFFFVPNGGSHRAVRRDVEAMQPPGGMDHDGKRATVELNRPGFYDALPEAVFHQSERPRSNKPKPTAKEQFLQNEDIAAKARSLFQPLDHELMWSRVLIELNERRLTTDLLDDRTGKGVHKFWDLPAFFSKEEKGDLLMLLPLCHKLVGNLPFVAEAIREILQVPVALQHRIVARHLDLGPDLPGLADAQLGVDSILAGEASTFERALEVVIGPLEPALANAFAEGQSGNWKLHYVLDLLIPAEQYTVIHVEVAAEAAGARLSVDGSFCRLGLTSILN